MEILFISILMLMLLMIAAGSVAYCYSVGRKATRALRHSELALDAAGRQEIRLDNVESTVIAMQEEEPQNEPQRVTEPVVPDESDEQMRKMEEQYVKLMTMKPPELLNLGG